MARAKKRGAASALSAVWLLIFALDASLSGRGLGHQLGALALGLLFAALVVSELRSDRRVDDEGQR